MATGYLREHQWTAAAVLSEGDGSLGLLAGEAIDWSRVHVYWVDERAVPADHARSNVRAVREAFVAKATMWRRLGAGDPEPARGGPGITGR